MNFPTFTAEASLYESGQHRAVRRSIPAQREVARPAPWCIQAQEVRISPIRNVLAKDVVKVGET